MRALELVRGSVEEAELLEATASAHGAWVFEAAPLMERVWLMRSAWAPGLRYVGGMASTGLGASRVPVLPVGSAGLRLEDALAGCLAEAVERTGQVEHDGDVALSAPVADVRVPDQIGELIARLVTENTATAVATIDWVRARNLATGGEALLPADWCLRRTSPGPLAMPGSALSTGCAAAATSDDAVERGLAELLERDAAALWWLGGASAAALHPATPEAAAAARMSGELRLDFSNSRITRVLDITSDLALPAFAAVSHHQDGVGLAIGLCAHHSAARAVSGALLELSQMELALQLATGKRDQLGDGSLTADDRRHLARAAIAVEDVPQLSESAAPRRHLKPNPATDGIGAILARSTIDAWAVDLTRPGRRLAVAKVIAPRLQPMPGDIATARLAARGVRTPPLVALM